MKYLQQLYIQVLLGIVLGVILGIFEPEIAASLQPLANLFINLIKMVIAPIIFCTVVTGIVHMGDMKKAGRLGFKALLYFEIITTLALILGLVVGNLSGVGSDMGIDPNSLDANSVASIVDQSHHAHHSFMEFVLAIIPGSFLSGVVEGNLLQTLLAAILFAWAMLGMGEQGFKIAQGIDSISHVFFRIVAIIMSLAPIGAFGAMAYTVGKFGLGSLVDLFAFVGLFYITCIGFIFIVFGIVLKLTTGLSIMKLIRYIKGELIIVLGTSSSETVLPRIIDKLQRLGCAREVVGMVVPAGYSFNLDGTSIYFTLAVVFLANALGIPLTLEQQLSILAILLFTSKGAAAVVGSAFIVLAGTLSTVSAFPVAAVSLILGIDRFMSVARALTNLIGNCVATLIIARWEKSLDIPLAMRVLDGKLHPEGDTDLSQIVLSSSTPAHKNQVSKKPSGAKKIVVKHARSKKLTAAKAVTARRLPKD